MTTLISRFTPSLMQPETLEALFVQRSELAAQVLEDIRSGAGTAAGHSHLLIAPRGLGKTHFIALMKHRVVSDAELADRLRIAWLREEERGVTSFLELVMRILLALMREYRDVALDARIRKIYDLPVTQAERTARELLTDYLGERTLLLLAENLDAIFLGLKIAGQQALRGYLQEHNCQILATTTTLFNGISLESSPFYSFFHLHYLPELTPEETIALLARLAEVRQDRELVAFIHTLTGHARVHALHHITGGNPRSCVIFSECLTRETLDELVTPFMRMLDDLTPYFHGRLEQLSPQQQQLVAFLAHAGGAETVKSIARHSFISQQTAAKQMRLLKEMGYLLEHTPLRDKRQTYYELREPLMRLCLEVKEYRGESVRLFIHFLRNWFAQDEVPLGEQGNLRSAPTESIYSQARKNTYELFVREGSQEEGEYSCHELIDSLRQYQFDEVIEGWRLTLIGSEMAAARRIAQGIIHSISVLASPQVSEDQRIHWLMACRQLAEGHDALSLAVKMLTAATLYLNTDDDRLLLALPLEARILVVREITTMGAEARSREQGT